MRNRVKRSIVFGVKELIMYFIPSVVTINFNFVFTKVSAIDNGFLRELFAVHDIPKATRVFFYRNLLQMARKD